MARFWCVLKRFVFWAGRSMPIRLLPVTKTGSISIQKEVLLIAIRILDLLSLRGNSKGTKPLAI